MCLGTWSCHISAADGPIGLKIGLWLVLIIILIPYIHKKLAWVAGTTLNVESTLTLTLLRRPLIQVGQMVSGHFLRSSWVVCKWFGPWNFFGQTHWRNSTQCLTAGTWKGQASFFWHGSWSTNTFQSICRLCSLVYAIDELFSISVPHRKVNLHIKMLFYISYV